MSSWTNRTHSSQSTRGLDEMLKSERARLFALALAQLGNNDDAHDVVQEVFVRTARNWSSVSELDHPAAWMRRVALNCATDTLRARSRRGRLMVRLKSQPARAASVIDLPDSELWRAVARLPQRQREVVGLYYVVDLSVRDVALTLDIAEGTVRATLDQARANLRLQLREGPVLDG